MPNWRVDINISTTVTSAQIEDWGLFQANRPGPNGDLLSERILLDTTIGRDMIDAFLQWDIDHRAGNNRWSVNGATIKSGTDGEFILPNEFRSNAVTLANADVGRVIRIPAGQTPLATRGHYLITVRNGPNSVNVDGVLPVAATGLTFDINEPAEFLAVLTGT